MGRGSWNAQPGGPRPRRPWGLVSSRSLKRPLRRLIPMPGRLLTQISARLATAVFQKQLRRAPCWGTYGCSQLRTFPLRPPWEAGRLGCAQGCTRTY